VTRCGRLSRLVPALLVAAAAAPASAAGPVLRVERVDASRHPQMRAYVSVRTGADIPIPLERKDFKVFELKTNEVEPQKAQTLDAAGHGLAVVLVVQTSGAMLPVLDEIKKNAAGFIQSLGDRDQVGLVSYSDRAETLATLGDKSTAIAAMQKIQSTGPEYNLWDGVLMGLSMFQAGAVAVKAGATSAGSIPAARALVVLGDGRDASSQQGSEGVISDAKKRRVPIFAIGHSQVGGDALPALEELARRTGGVFYEAPGIENLGPSFGRAQQALLKQYVVEWKADEIEADGKKYDLEITVDVGDTRLRGAGDVTTPVIRSYTKWIVLGAIVLLLALIGFGVWWFWIREKPVALVPCPVCKRGKMPEWDVCLFCLKECKAKLQVTKGPSKGKVYPLVGKVVMVGKGPENSVRIPDPAVSTRHCGIQIDDSKFEIKDMGSANGTYVNGKKVQARFLRNGDLINLGQSELRFDSTIRDTNQGDFGDDGGTHVR